MNEPIPPPMLTKGMSWTAIPLEATISSVHWLFASSRGKACWFGGARSITSVISLTGSSFGVGRTEVQPALGR
jgi:hypothetical protein